MTTFIDGRNHDVVKAGIFIPPVDILSSIIFEASPQQGFAYMNDQYNFAFNYWITNFAVLGLAQYSRIFAPAIAIVRSNIYYRPATDSELQFDAKSYWPMVQKPSMPKYDSTKTAQVSPEKFEKFVFVTKIVEGCIPLSVDCLVAELDSASREGDMIVSQGYSLFYSESGRLFHTSFMDISQYSVKKLEDAGIILVDPDKKVMFWRGSNGSFVDYSSELREDLLDNVPIIQPILTYGPQTEIEL